MILVGIHRGGPGGMTIVLETIGRTASDGRAGSGAEGPDGPSLGVLDAILTRRSVGKVRDEAPPRAVIEELLLAATWAPNHRLTEPWRFWVLAGDARRDFGEALGRAAVARMAADSDKDPAAVFAAAAAKALRAPVVIAVAVEPVVAPKVVELEEITAGAAAIQNLLLAAHARGLATIWRTGEPCYAPEVKAYFDLAPTAHLLGFVYLGYPAGEPPTRERTPVAAKTLWLGWPDGDEDGDAFPATATRTIGA